MHLLYRKEKRLFMLAYLKNKAEDFDAIYFLNELSDAFKNLGILEAKVEAYKFNSILIPILHKKEAISSMYIEGTQTTISDILENEINPKEENEKIAIEVKNHTQSLIQGATYLHIEPFSHNFIKELHRIMMDGIISNELKDTLGQYKKVDNQIVNSAKTVVYIPPSHKDTKKYMDELITYMNNNDNVHPLIKAAIIHSQFESIHPFSDGNGRVGRILISLYLYKAGVINFPFFYISEAISQDKSVYYNMLTNSRKEAFTEWIKYFLNKIIIQTQKHILYIDSLEQLYIKTKKNIQKIINSPKFDDIIEYIFTHPVLNAKGLADSISVSRGQATRYLNNMESENILLGNDRKRGRTFFFAELIDIVRGI